MTLFDFEEDIDDIILNRGWDYYQNGFVKSIHQQKDTHSYRALVAGTRNYTVKVELSSTNDIIYTECDCPYDGGPYCKHEVAVFYALREKLSKLTNNITQSLGEKEKPGKSPKVVPPFERYYHILSAQPKEKLVHFLASLALEYNEIGQRVELEFDSKDEKQEVKRCISLIRSYIRQHSDIDGFIPYKEAFGATKGARMVIERAEKATSCGEYTRALGLYLCVLHEMVPLLQYADDSSGSISTVIEETLEGIKALVDQVLTSKESEHFFRELLKEASNKIYEGWDNWKLELLEACATLAVTQERREILEKHLQSIIESLEDTWTSRYLAERVTLIQYQLLIQFEGEDKAADFIEQNISFPHFREMAIREALSKKQYDRAESLALDGERHDRGMYGLVNKWRELRYEAYRRSGQLDKQRNLAIEFILDGNFEYYKKLKATYSREEWSSVYPNIIRLLEKKDGYSSILPDILIEEGELKKLLDYVKVRPGYILKVL